MVFGPHDRHFCSSAYRVDPCGVGSMWCWMVVTWAPVTTVVSFVLKHCTNFKPIVGIKFEQNER
jgi:hypothetical protein